MITNPYHLKKRFYLKKGEKWCVKWSRHNSMLFYRRKHGWKIPISGTDILYNSRYVNCGSSICNWQKAKDVRYMKCEYRNSKWEHLQFFNSRRSWQRGVLWRCWNWIRLTPLNWEWWWINIRWISKTLG